MWCAAQSIILSGRLRRIPRLCLPVALTACRISRKSNVSRSHIIVAVRAHTRTAHHFFTTSNCVPYNKHEYGFRLTLGHHPLHLVSHTRHFADRNHHVFFHLVLFTSVPCVRTSAFPKTIQPMLLLMRRQWRWAMGIEHLSNGPPHLNSDIKYDYECECTDFRYSIAIYVRT